jgi:uncharacterized membrane protein
MIIIYMAVGALIGLVVSEAWLMNMVIGETRWLALAAGAAFGALWSLHQRQEKRISSLEQRLAAPRDPAATEPTKHSTTTAEEPAPTEPARTPSPTQTSQPETTRPAPTPGVNPAPEVQPAPTSPTWQIIRNWFTEGNVPVKVGVLVSFIGVAALLRYANEQGWLTVPIEVRLASIAGVAILALLFGWRQRDRRRVFALSIQGGAIGVLLLTIFAAFRLYSVLPSGMALALMIVLVGAGGVLAIAQQALALAILSMLAGFAAPFLVGSGEGQPLILFSWYAVLNLGVFAMARYRSWPVLNRLGFVFTFVFASFWGVLAWTPEHYPVAQAFLILFSALYFLIPILQTRLDLAAGNARLDVWLVFGLPLFAFPLQIALLEADRLPVAYSAFAAALVYLASAAWLIRMEGFRTLALSHAVLAIGLATLAVPFAFSGPTITVIWALEGAALVWFGCLQQRRWPRFAGLALQLVAAMIWLVNRELDWQVMDLIFLNTLFMGGLALAFAAGISAWFYDRAGASALRINVLVVWALLLWSLNGLMELQAHVPSDSRASALIAFWAVTALIGAAMHWRLSWASSGLAPALALLFCALLVFDQRQFGLPLVGWAGASWLLVIMASLVIDRWFAAVQTHWRDWSVLAAHTALIAVLAVTAVDVVAAQTHMGQGWQWLFGALPLLLLMILLQGGCRPPLCLSPVPNSTSNLLSGACLTVAIFGLIISLTASADAKPLPWIPLLNPLEISQGIVLMLLLLVTFRPRQSLSISPVLPAALGLLLVTAAGLRGVHHLAEVDWRLFSLLGSNIGQATLSLVWTTAGVAAWVWGSRWRQPVVWWTGAIILGIVLLKLLLIDRQFLSTVAGILSFLAFGILSILVGYLAPAPPRREAQTESNP